MANKRGSLVVVLAGYQKQMEELLGYNEGLPSRFPLEFTFPDYADEELLTIFNGIMEADKTRFTLQVRGAGFGERGGVRPICVELKVVE